MDTLPLREGLTRSAGGRGVCAVAGQRRIKAPCKSRKPCLQADGLNADETLPENGLNADQKPRNPA